MKISLPLSGLFFARRKSMVARMPCRDGADLYKGGGLYFVGRTPKAGFAAGNSSPKCNRLDQCLLGSKESQKMLISGADL